MNDVYHLPEVTRRTAKEEATLRIESSQLAEYEFAGEYDLLGFEWRDTNQNHCDVEKSGEVRNYVRREQDGPWLSTYRGRLGELDVIGYAWTDDAGNVVSVISSYTVLDGTVLSHDDIKERLRLHQIMETMLHWRTSPQLDQLRDRRIKIFGRGA